MLILHKPIQTFTRERLNTRVSEPDLRLLEGRKALEQCSESRQR